MDLDHVPYFTKFGAIGQEHLRKFPFEVSWPYIFNVLSLPSATFLLGQRLGHRDAMVTATIYAHVSLEQTETASSRFALASETI